MATIAPAESALLPAAVRCACFPRSGDSLLGSEHFRGPDALAKYNAQFDIWCCMKDGTITVRDAREVELGVDPGLRSHASPVLKWESLHSVAYRSSFPVCIAAVKRSDPHPREVWIGFSDGPIRVFEESPPYRAIAELGIETNKGAPSSLDVSYDATLVAAACGDDHIVVYDVVGKVVHRRLLGHTGPVRVAAFVGRTQRILSSGVDGVMCLWDTAGDEPILRVPLTPGQSIACLLVVSLNAAESKEFLLRRRQPSAAQVEDELVRGADATWSQIWVGGEAGKLWVYLVPDDSTEFAFFTQHYYHYSFRSGLTSLRLHHGTEKIVHVMRAKSTKVRRYSAITLRLLPPLVPPVKDGSSSIGAYPTVSVCPATLTPVWAVDTAGHFTKLSLERVGTVGTESDQRAAALRQQKRLMGDVSTLRDEIKVYRDFSDYLLRMDAQSNPELAAALETAKRSERLIGQRRWHAVHLLERRAHMAIQLRYLRRLFLWHSEKKYYLLRRQSLDLYQINRLRHARGAFAQWAIGASRLKLRRLRIDAAINLREVTDRVLLKDRLTVWRRFQGQRNAAVRMIRVFHATATRMRTRFLSRWRLFVKRRKEDRAKEQILTCLRSSLASGLRLIYFSKWLQLGDSSRTRSALKQAARGGLGLVMALNERQRVGLYFRWWMEHASSACARRRRNSTCHFVGLCSEKYLGRHFFSRWRRWARMKVSRRVSAQTNSTLMRLSNDGMRRAYFRTWKSRATIRQIASGSLQNATAHAAISFITARSRRALSLRYFAKWSSFAVMMRQLSLKKRAVDRFLRETLLFQLLRSFHTWKKHVSIAKTAHEKALISYVLDRRSSDVLRRQFFTAWLRLQRHSKRMKKRRVVLDTFARASMRDLCKIYFLRWLSWNRIGCHLREVTLYMTNSATGRSKRLRSVYLGKWMNWTARITQRRARRLVSETAVIHDSLNTLNDRLFTTEKRIDETRDVMRQIALDTEDAFRRAQQHESRVSDVTASIRHLDAQFQLQREKLGISEDRILSYVLTLKTPKEHPASLASRWRNEWLLMEHKLRQLSHRGADAPVTIGTFTRDLNDLTRACEALRHTIASDIEAHLSIHHLESVSPPEKRQSARPAVEK